MTKNFLNNADLLAEIIACQATNTISPTLYEMMRLLIAKIAIKPNWRNYSWVDEFKADAMLAMVHTPKLNRQPSDIPACLKFNPAKSTNPFAYYTTIIHNSFLRTLKKELAQRDTKDGLMIREGFEPSFYAQEKDRDLLADNPVYPCVTVYSNPDKAEVFNAGPKARVYRHSHKDIKPKTSEQPK